MTRLFIIPLLLFAFFMQTFSQAFVVMDYYINTAAFAKNCENKEKPVLKCNGKCQMMKKLQEEEKQEKQNPELKGGLKSDLVLYPFAGALSIAYAFMETITEYQLYRVAAPVHQAARIFHPPALF